MDAVVYERYGSPDVLRLTDVPKPSPSPDEILIRIRATSLNRSDWETLTGSPVYARLGGMRRPRRRILGSDIAGTVEQVGAAHTRFAPGDEVFGDILGRMGGFAEFVCARGRTIALKPPTLSFEDASTIPQAGVIALQAIRDKGRAHPGQRLLINGAGGGTGPFAIQLAKRSGAEVTGVDNTAKIELMRSLGADHTIDYTKQDFTRTGQRYDFILDLVARRPVRAYLRALEPGGTCLLVGGSVRSMLACVLLGPFIRPVLRKTVGVLVVKPNREDMQTVAELCVNGELRTVIDRRYSLAEVPEALRRLGADAALGKLVVVQPDA